MPNLTRSWVWERWVPRFGDNDESETPFYLEVASGLTKEALETFRSAFEKGIVAPENGDAAERWLAWSRQLADAFGKYVRIGKEPLRIVDAETKTVVFDVKDLGDLFLLCLQGPSSVIWDLSGALRDYNSIGGQLELFYARRSGGTGITPARNAAKDEKQAAGP